jgi:hypothetical protein
MRQCPGAGYGVMTHPAGRRADRSGWEILKTENSEIPKLEIEFHASRAGGSRPVPPNEACHPKKAQTIKRI